MTDIPLYGGPIKREIIQFAFEECGQAGYEFELTPEEYNSALRRMNALLSEWLSVYGIDLGYNFPTNGNGSADDESGIPDATMNVVASSLARRIAPSIGKTMGAEATAALAASFTALRSKYAVVPMMEMGRHTPIGAGNRRRWRRSPFFAVDISDAEIVQ